MVRILLNRSLSAALSGSGEPLCFRNPAFPGLLVADNPWIREWAGWLRVPGRVCRGGGSADGPVPEGGLLWVLPAAGHAPQDSPDPCGCIRGLRLFAGDGGLPDTVFVHAGEGGLLIDGPCLPQAPVPAGQAAVDRETAAWIGGGALDLVRRTRIGCVGAGGHGSPLLQAAVRHGFRRFTIVDGDRLEAGNLNRFYGGGRADCGRHKTALLAAALLACAPEAEVRTVEAWFPAEAAERALADCDVLFSCVDNDAARRSLQLFALALNLPLFDLAAGIGPPGGSGDPLPEAGGQLRIFLPGGPCLGCMGLRPDGEGFPRGGRTGGCLADGAGPSSGVVTLNGIMALLGLGKMVEWLCGAGLEARHLKYRSRPATIYQIRETRRAGCPLCGNPLPGGT